MAEGDRADIEPRPGATSRDRVMDAVVVCVDRSGLGGFGLEDVASEAGVSRATIYRQFEGGRDQLIRETVMREVARFWAELALAVADIADLEGRLVAGLMLARQRLAEHDLLQKLLASEAEEFLPALFESEPIVHMVIREYMTVLLAAEQLRPGVDVELAADYLTRMLVMHIGTPGRWDLADEDQVRRLVSTQFLAGLVPD